MHGIPASRRCAPIRYIVLLSAKSRSREITLTAVLATFPRFEFQPAFSRRFVTVNSAIRNTVERSQRESECARVFDSPKCRDRHFFLIVKNTNINIFTIFLTIKYKIQEFSYKNININIFTIFCNYKR